MDTIDDIKGQEKSRHPDANTALFLGIGSIITSIAPLGLAMAIFALIASTRTLKAYKLNSYKYSRNSYTRGLAGMIFGITSIFLFILASTLYVIMT